MPIAKTIAEQLEHSSWIRRMFEEGARLKRERGAENVYDYTLGNPDVEPPVQVLDALKRVVATFFQGSVAQAVAALLEAADTRLSDSELQDLQQTIEQTRKEGR